MRYRVGKGLRRRNPSVDPRYLVEFRGGVVRPVWEISPSQYQAAIGVHQPWIAEISPMQYAGLSKRGKAAYDAKRAREWDASAAAKDHWRDLILEAHDAGLFNRNDAGVSREADNAVFFTGQARAEAARAASFDDIRRENEIHTPAAAPVGSVVWNIIYNGYARVVKHRQSRLVVQMLRDGSEVSKPAGAFTVLHYNELKKAHEAGAQTHADLLGFSAGMAAPKSNPRRAVKRGNPLQKMEDLRQFSVGDSIFVNAGRGYAGALSKIHEMGADLVGPRGGSAVLVANKHSGILHLIVIGRGMPRVEGPVRGITHWTPAPRGKKL